MYEAKNLNNLFFKFKNVDLKIIHHLSNQTFHQAVETMYEVHLHWTEYFKKPYEQYKKKIVSLGIFSSTFSSKV